MVSKAHKVSRVLSQIALNCITKYREFYHGLSLLSKADSINLGILIVRQINVGKMARSHQVQGWLSKPSRCAAVVFNLVE